MNIENIIHNLFAGNTVRISLFREREFFTAIEARGLSHKINLNTLHFIEPQFDSESGADEEIIYVIKNECLLESDYIQANVYLIIEALISGQEVNVGDHILQHVKETLSQIDLKGKSLILSENERESFLYEANYQARLV